MNTYGPNTAQVEAYLALLPTLTDAQWDAVRDAARDAARYAAWAAGALVVRDLITDKQFEALAAPMRAAGVDFDALIASRLIQEVL